jgi:hypothetical protein
VKASYTLSASIFTAEVTRAFYYFNGFPDDEGIVRVDIGKDLCFITVHAVECLPTVDHSLSILVSLVYSSILTECSSMFCLYAFHPTSM